MKKDTLYDIIIVGCGPAGMTAGIYAERSNKEVLILEANTYGGQIITTLDIENYPVEAHISGYDFATKLYNQTLELGAEVKFEKVVKIELDGDIKVVTTNKHEYRGKSIILATGAENRKLGIEGEEEYLGKGVSYCATCDGALFKNRNVAVCGGGNSAVEDALYLSDICNRVFIIHRRDEFKAEPILVRKLKRRENVDILLNSNVTKLYGDKKIEGIEVTDDKGEIRKLRVSGLFIAVGRVPENQSFASLVDMNEAGYVIADEDCHTSREGIFVAGDNRVKSLRQLVTATSDGAIAATEAVKYINSKKWEGEEDV